MSERLVVIGGDAAGMSAASQARRRDEDLEIVAYERGGHTSYSACGIPYWLAGIVDDVDDLVARTPEEFRERGIDAHIRHEVTGIDVDAGAVTVRDLDRGRERTEGYDQLLIATGASPVVPPIEGTDLPGVVGVQTLDDGEAVLETLRSRRPRTAVVIGAGYVGLEMAEAMIHQGLDVHLLDRDPRPMNTLDADMGERVGEAMAGMGIRLDLGVEAEGIVAGDDGRVAAVATDRGEIPCDLVVLGAGAVPNSGLGRAAGLPVGEHGGLVVDRRQHTPVDGVWAAGDCVETFHRVSQRPVAIALGTIANKQGRVAGINLGGGYATFPGVLGTAVTKVCGLEIARTGLGEQEAVDAGFAPVCSVITSTTRAGYYPGGGELTIKTIAERGSGRLLGAQIVGEEGAAKRIDVLAMALWHATPVEELLNVDLSYAPPFSPVWDPVLVAARKAWSDVQADRAR